MNAGGKKEQEPWREIRKKRINGIVMKIYDKEKYFFFTIRKIGYNWEDFIKAWHMIIKIFQTLIFFMSLFNMPMNEIGQLVST